MNYQIKFNRPEPLKNPLPQYLKMLEILYKNIGQEQLNSRLETISLEWGLQSGYSLSINKNTLEFTHVSLI